MKRTFVSWLCGITFLAYFCRGLDNGVELTPAMGFMDWEKFRCEIDCTDYPDDCINENLFMTMADAMVANGMRDAGYIYVSIDDCWMSKNRTEDGQLQPDPERFPSGIKALAQYMHDRGMKLGIYEDFGTYTCMGYPGSEGHEQTDANTFAEWEVDMLKFDGCYSNASSKEEGYIHMGRYLNATGRPILYACSWPAYLKYPNYSEIAPTCNQWRNQADVQDSFASVLGIIDSYTSNRVLYAEYQGPGHFNDPDELVVGDSLTLGQERVQMTMWVMWSAPLFVSSDLRSIRQESLDILLNKYAIAIDQDPLGLFAVEGPSSDDTSYAVWIKTLAGAYSNDTSAVGVNALSFITTADTQVTVQASASYYQLVPPPEGFNLLFIDVFNKVNKTVAYDDPLQITIAPSDARLFITRFVPISEMQTSDPVFENPKSESKSDDQKSPGTIQWKRTQGKFNGGRMKNQKYLPKILREI